MAMPRVRRERAVDANAESQRASWNDTLDCLDRR
jgi:hypothetical protein